MSDNWLILIPAAADYVPTVEAQEKAAILMKEIAPGAGGVMGEESAYPQFIFCGGNFERILCPDCGKEIVTKWWSEAMNEEHPLNFPLRPRTLPCCGSSRNLNELIYHWPQGFARFTLEAKNPGIPKIAGKDLERMEKILGCRLKVVWRHI